MDFMNPDVRMFFDPHPAALPLYEAFAGEMAARFPETRVRVQKTQITLYNRRVYACVSFLRVKRKAELPASWFTLTLGLPDPLESPRVAARVEPYPGRWTTHIVLSDPSELDAELFGWVEQAYEFAESKA
ncbi:MAG: DUF5655 domain-containing protein [Clostridia bacterium]|nr:DUF5655 domain-containing protein [Clostridia bacterium]